MENFYLGFISRRYYQNRFGKSRCSSVAISRERGVPTPMAYLTWICNMSAYGPDDHEIPQGKTRFQPIYHDFVCCNRQIDGDSGPAGSCRHVPWLFGALGVKSDWRRHAANIRNPFLAPRSRTACWTALTCHGVLGLACVSSWRMRDTTSPSCEACANVAG
ncbi:hypothetical protein M426DRAFT_190392 [Hypoxylon sp. CI-4A]|nr:hypothetical protein M426DRAFT_190392 [Hypoxylon sp. CI-4A]